MKNISVQPQLSKILIFVIFVSTICLALIWTGQNSFAERVITVRYFLFALTGLVAFLTPYILFPDRNVSVLQLGNLPGISIRRYILKKVLNVTWPVFLLIALMFLGDMRNPLGFLAEKVLYLTGSFSFLGGILLVSTGRYMRSGESSQFWKESEKGRKLRKNLADYFKYPINPGTLPSLLNTVLVFLGGSVSLVVGSFLGQYGPAYAEPVFFLVILVSGTSFFFRNTEDLVRNFYSTNAFFREFFGVSLAGADVAMKREIGQLWWVPKRLKAHVWQFLTQLDRKIPAGRAVAAGHLAVWFIAYQRPEPEFLTVIWILFALLHQLLIVMSIQPDMAPYWLLRWIGKNYIWTLSRFWMQLRWIVSLLLSMSVQYFIFGTPGLSEQAIVIVLFMMSAFLTSLYGTMKLRQDLKT